jgi:hypothetical protein
MRLKGTLKGQAKVSICRDNKGMISLEIWDANRRSVICEVHMTPEAFAMAVTGAARQEGALYVNTDYDPEEHPYNE